MKAVYGLLVAVVIVGVVGFYLGWFSFSMSDDDRKPNITLSVDKDKIEADKDKVVDKVQDLGSKDAD